VESVPDVASPAIGYHSELVPREQVDFNFALIEGLSHFSPQIFRIVLPMIATRGEWDAEGANISRFSQSALHCIQHR
jgi:hypothetical protein